MSTVSVNRRVTLRVRNIILLTRKNQYCTINTCSLTLGSTLFNMYGAFMRWLMQINCTYTCGAVWPRGPGSGRDILGHAYTQTEEEHAA